jgi:hypothetical protein
MKSLDVLREILAEAQVNTGANTNRDWKTIQSRYEHEGISFLGITLPEFCVWLETSIRDGQAATWIYSRFRKKAGKRSVLPCFLHGLTSLVFTAETGLIRSDLDENAVFFIRQITLFHKKVFEVCSPERDRASNSAYEECDLELRKYVNPTGSCASYVRDVLGRVIPDLESAFVEAIADESILPKHGPGATADKLWGNGKYKDKTFYRRWEGIFSWEELYGFHTVDQLQISMVEPADERPSRVVSVPKTMKTSRIIAVEPTAMQYAQQLTSARLRRAFKVTGIHRQLNLDDQTVNQRLARQGSMSGEWATLDLSEASDRLHSKVVSFFLGKAPTLRRHVFACRSSRARLADGRVLPLRKYASMGSALTFPLEAFCFWAIAVAGLLKFYEPESARERNRSMRERGRMTRQLPATYHHCFDRVFVFGDDIIVPAEAASFVVEFLEAYGLKVNTKKSFTKGPVRESCGHDYVNGCLVTPVYLRQWSPASLRDGVKVVSWVNMANRFHSVGLWATSNYVRKFLDSIHKFPDVSPRCMGLGYVHYTGRHSAGYLNRDGYWSTKTYVATSRVLNDILDGDEALTAFFLKAVGPQGERHSVLSGSPQRNSLRLRKRMVPV